MIVRRRVGHQNAKTELPFISIGAEMWRGFRDCGEALASIGAAAAHSGSSPASAQAASLGKAMLAEAAPLLTQLRTSMLADAGPRNSSGAPRCWSYVAGMPGVCGMIKPEASNRDSE